MRLQNLGVHGTRTRYTLCSSVLTIRSERNMAAALAVKRSIGRPVPSCTERPRRVQIVQTCI